MRLAFGTSHPPARWAIMLLVFLVLAGIGLHFDARALTFFDGLGYFSYLPALFAGRPFDLQEFAVPDVHSQWRDYPATGRTVNPWGIGPALLWLPWYAAVRLAIPNLPGVHGFYWLACALGTVCLTMAGVILLYLALTRLVARWAAFAAALCSVLATSVVAYAGAVPFTSHAQGYALVSLLLWLLVTGRHTRWQHWLALGVICGLLAASRMQAVLVLLLLPAVRWPGARRLLPLAAGFLLMFGPQMLFWRMTFGQWLVLPQQRTLPDFIHAPAVLSVLFSPQHGLLSTHPLLIAAIAGLAAMALRSPHRRLAGMALLVFALQVIVNAMPFDWWAGWSFGARRFSDMVPLLALGLGYALSRLPWLSLMAAAAIWWNLALLWAWLSPLPQGPLFFSLAGRIVHPLFPLTGAVLGDAFGHLVTTPLLIGGLAASLAACAVLIRHLPAPKPEPAAAGLEPPPA